MNATEFKKWLVARGARCRLDVDQGDWLCLVFNKNDPEKESEARSPELEDAVRAAQHLYDAAYQNLDTMAVIKKYFDNTFPCPECGQIVNQVRAVALNTGAWRIESAFGVGSLQACCVAPDLTFATEREAHEFAVECERGARSTINP